MSLSHNSVNEVRFDYEFEDESKDQEQPDVLVRDDLDYCLFWTAVPVKMKDHNKAHSLRAKDKLIEAFKFY